MRVAQLKECHTKYLTANTIATEALDYTFRGFPTRMVYLYYISCLRYTILVGNPQFTLKKKRKKKKEKKKARKLYIFE